MVALNLLANSEVSTDEDEPPRRNTRTPQLREMRYRTTAPYFQQTGHRAARDIPVEGFRIDRTSDLIASIGGRAGGAAFARSVLGGRSLRFRTEVSQVEDFVDLSSRVFAVSRCSDYKDSFPWVDNITLVEDESTIADLRRRLIALFRENPIPSTVDAILPDDLLEVDDERAIRYILFPGEHAKKAATINLTVGRLALFVSRLAESGNPEAVFDCELRFLDDAQEKIGTGTVLECICADLLVDKEQFIAYDGDFYRVDQTFVQRINQELTALAHTVVDFPAYRGETEPGYTARLSQNGCENFVVLDRALIRVEGESGIEASDLVSSSGTLVHIKRKGKSSTLSHLFLQAANSCELLRRSAVAREQLCDLIKQRSSSPQLAADINEVHSSKLVRGLEVTFGFLGDWRGRTVNSLPLFSRISLVQASRKIDNLGYQPTLALISIR